MIITTERLILASVKIDQAAKVLKYYRENQEFLEPWESKRDEAFYTLKGQIAEIRNSRRLLKKDQEYRFWISKKTRPDRYIGSAALNCIIRGNFQSCFLGYKLHKDEINQGYMTEAIQGVLEFGFEGLKLHRIEANIIPRNASSLRVVEKLGFTREGYSEKYLNINGAWEDHIRFAMLNGGKAYDDHL
ncbi:MAG: GNAT family N-acetyltransferase [Eubacteriaceae bacterium]|nr:GNAT family N-acetyltransferase [Eubacteriaceae bacterium]